MSSFAPHDVQRLATLARIELHASEIPAFTRQLNEILAFAQQVQGVDTAEAGEPSGAPAPAMRDDELAASLPREEALGAAAGADLATGLITVPRVIGG